MAGNKIVRPRILGVAALAVALGGCTTYGTGVSPGRQTVSDLTGVVSLGSGKKEPIEYTQRPPIVTPPSTDVLPKPGEPQQVADWPNDPDEAEKARKAAAGPKKQETLEENLADPGFRLPSQSSGRRYEEANDPNSAENQIFGMQRQKDEIREIRAKAKAGAAGQVDAAGNPVRTTLTEPPAEYRVPDPSAPEEFAAAKDEKWWQVFRKGKPASKPAPVPVEAADGAADAAEGAAEVAAGQ